MDCELSHHFKSLYHFLSSETRTNHRISHNRVEIPGNPLLFNSLLIKKRHFIIADSNLRTPFNLMAVSARTARMTAENKARETYYSNPQEPVKATSHYYQYELR